MRPSVPALLAAALIAGATVAAPPAGAAATGWSAPKRLTGDGCDVARTTTDAAGVTRGFARCRVRATADVLVYVQGSAGRWTTTVTTGRGVPLAVADDGARTRVLYAEPGSSPRLRMLTRTRGGSVSVRLVTTTGGAGQPAGDQRLAGASLLAQGGRWLAVWGVTDRAFPYPSRLWQAGDLIGGASPRDTGLRGDEPSLAPARTGVQVAYVSDVDSAIEIGAARAGGGWTSARVGGSVVPRPAPSYVQGGRPTLQYSDRATRLVVMLEQFDFDSPYFYERADGSSTWRGRVVGGAAQQGTTAHIAAHGSRLLIALTAERAPDEGTGWALVAERRGSVWTRAYYGDGTSASAGGVIVEGVGAGATGGVLVMRHARIPSWLSARTG
jgi:hypothetical protein